MKAFIIAVVFLLCGTSPWLATRATAQVDSSCLVLWQDAPLFIGSGYAWSNQDSVRVDVCPGPQYLQEYAKDSFLFYFRYYIIPIPDSIALKGDDTATHTWQNIDTSYTGLRDSFSRIEQQFGTFTIQHLDDGPGDTSTDEDGWIINFNQYLNIDTVDNALSELPDISLSREVYFLGHPSFYESVNINPSLNDIRIWPEPCNLEVNISGNGTNSNAKFFDPLGRQVKLPIAQSDNEITVDISLTA